MKLYDVTVPLLTRGLSTMTVYMDSGEAFAREFDAKLDGRISKLVDYSPNCARVMADAYRAVVGLTEAACSDTEAIDRLRYHILRA